MIALTRKMLASRALRFLCPRVTRRFIRQNDGAAAVEFGLVAAPFLALIFAIMETALVFFAGQTMETAAADTGRLIMTGQAKALGITDQATFKAEVCKRIFALFDCPGKMLVDVRKYTSLASADLSKPIDSTTGELKNDFKYEQTVAGDLVIVRLFYEYPIYVSQLGLNLTDMGGNKRLLVATSAFRNEPFQ
ncbi:MAG TPA: TadE/TadG family type IV pilus assembly protein [Candidatus Binatia bacterium]|nr:TadE/TadG family type IV pilus assembly protein [Candidatus Binatia bacterium]